MLGAVVDQRYRIVAHLGMGGMGVVYLAEHIRLRRRYAIKVLNHDLSRQSGFVARFLREARAATEIDHPNVIEVVDTGNLADGRAYYVMEHLLGEDLATLLRHEGRLSWPRVRHITLQICAGLGAAHAKGIVHRDLKPANCVRITRTGDPDFIKILDFGIAKLLDGQVDTLTGTGELLGTLSYMAPEQAMGEAIDHRVDIYSLGVMLYLLVSGSHPFPGRNSVEMLYALLHKSPTALRAVAGDPTLPRELDEIVAAAMHRDPSQRIPTMEALAELLAAVPDAAMPAKRMSPATTVPVSAEPGPIVVTPLQAIVPYEYTSDLDDCVTALNVRGAQQSPIASVDAGEHLHGRSQSPAWGEYPADEPPSESQVLHPPSETLAQSGPPGRQRRGIAGWSLASALLLLVPLGYAVFGSHEAFPVSAEQRVDEVVLVDEIAPRFLATSPPAEMELAERDDPAERDEPTELRHEDVVQPPQDPPLAFAEEPRRYESARRPSSSRTDTSETSEAPPAKPTLKDLLEHLRVVKRLIQAKCRSELISETVIVDLWIEAGTGALRRREVQAPHDSVPLGGCITGVLDRATFPKYTGADFEKSFSIDIKPRHRLPSALTY